MLQFEELESRELCSKLIYSGGCGGDVEYRSHRVLVIRGPAMVEHRTTEGGVGYVNIVTQHGCIVNVIDKSNDQWVHDKIRFRD